MKMLKKIKRLWTTYTSPVFGFPSLIMLVYLVGFEFVGSVRIPMLHTVLTTNNTRPIEAIAVLVGINVLYAVIVLLDQRWEKRFDSVSAEEYRDEFKTDIKEHKVQDLMNCTRTLEFRKIYHYGNPLTFIKDIL